MAFPRVQNPIPTLKFVHLISGHHHPACTAPSSPKGEKEKGERKGRGKGEKKGKRRREEEEERLRKRGA